MQKNTKAKHSGRGLLKHDLERLRTVLAMTAKDMRGEAKNALSDSYENVKDKTFDIRENIADYVSSKPAKAMAIAFASGILLSLALRSKKRRIHH